MSDHYISLVKNDHEWDNFQANSIYSSVFTSSKFINSLKLNSHKIFLRDGKNILAACILFKDNSNSVPYSNYQGIILGIQNVKNQRQISKNFTYIIAKFLRIFTRFFC